MNFADFGLQFPIAVLSELSIRRKINGGKLLDECQLNFRIKLIEVYTIAISKVISGWVLTYDRPHA